MIQYFIEEFIGDDAFDSGKKTKWFRFFSFELNKDNINLTQAGQN